MGEVVCLGSFGVQNDQGLGDILRRVPETEASGECLIRHSGTDDALTQAAIGNVQNIGAGHCFCLVLGPPVFPISILNTLQAVPEVCRIYCATANPVQVIVAETSQGRGILGVIDGASPLGVENDQNIADRRQLLKTFGYKL